MVRQMICLFNLILNVPVNSFSVISGWVSLGCGSTKQRIMLLAQRHNVVPPVRLDHTFPRSPVKHSTTEPPRSSLRQMKAKQFYRFWSHLKG